MLHTRFRPLALPIRLLALLGLLLCSSSANAQADAGTAANLPLLPVAQDAPAPDPPRLEFAGTDGSPPAAATTPSQPPNTEWTLHKSADGTHPSGQEQQALWLMNRARANPTQEGIWLATSSIVDIASPRTYFGVNLAVLQAEFASYAPQPPAAFDARLYTAARAHSEALIQRDAQDHVGQFERVEAAGFVMAAARGNVYSYARGGLHAHAGFNIDWGPGTADGMQTGRGHRKAVMSLDGDYTNVGIALLPEENPATRVGPWVTTANYAQASSYAADHYNRFLVGTVWYDANENGLYDPGEGIAGVTVTPDRGPFYAITAAGGGYAMPITAAGAYEISFSGPVHARRQVEFDAVSLLLDLQQQQTFSVSGRVVQANGLPYPGVQIRAGALPPVRSDSVGAYIVTDLFAGSHTLEPTAPDRRFEPSQRQVRLPPNAEWQDFTVLPAPIAQSVSPSGGQLLYTDTQGLLTRFVVPQGALPGPLTLVITPTLTALPADRADAGHAFDLAFLDAQGQPALTLAMAITVEIEYSQADVALISAIEELALLRQSGYGWQPAAAHCTPAPPAVHQPATRLYTTAVCRPGRYALVGPTARSYLPLAMR